MVGTVPIAVMGLLDDAVVIAIPDALDAGVADLLVRGSPAFSLVVAFLVTTPVNRSRSAAAGAMRSRAGTTARTDRCPVLRDRADPRRFEC